MEIGTTFWHLHKCEIKTQVHGYKESRQFRKEREGISKELTETRENL
jgi:hypothetical protein